MPFQIMLPGRYGIPYYGPPRFILLLAQPQHLRPEIPQQPPRIQVLLPQEMPIELWQRIAFPPQFAPATATTPVPATAIPTAPPFIVQGTGILDLNNPASRWY